MAKPARGGRSRGRRGGKNRSKKTSVIHDTVKLSCVRCGESIKHPETALATPESGEPIHFDCAIEEVADGEELEAGEKICYLGQGNFGIIQYKSGSSDREFKIRKKIAYESLEKEADWRKNMRDSLINPR